MAAWRRHSRLSGVAAFVFVGALFYTLAAVVLLGIYENCGGMMSATGEEMVSGIVELQQRDVVLMLEAGYLYMELNKPGEAEEVFTGVAAMLPHSEVPHLALGNLFFSIGRFNPSLKAHRRAVELNPESAAAHASVGEVLFFLRRSDEGLKSLDRAIELAPEDPAADFARALREAQGLGVFA